MIKAMTRIIRIGGFLNVTLEPIGTRTTFTFLSESMPKPSAGYCTFCDYAVTVCPLLSA